MDVKSFLEKRSIHNTREGFHVNSIPWKQYRTDAPPLSCEQKEIAIGMILGDAYVAHRVSKTGKRSAHIKFEQGLKQQPLILDLFERFKRQCMMEKPNMYMAFDGCTRTPKSTWFRTFNHDNFLALHELFYKRNDKKKRPAYRKIIKKGLVTKHVTPRALAYWLMSDGSRDHRVTTLHSSSFTEKENIILRDELRKRYNLQPKVKVSKRSTKKVEYFVLQFASSDAETLTQLCVPYVVPMFHYKL